MNLNQKISQKVLSNTRKKTKFLERNTETLQNELDSFKIIFENKKNNKMRKEALWEAGKTGPLMNYVKNLNNKEDIDMENIKKLRFLKHEERNIEKDLKNMKTELEHEKHMMKKMIKGSVKKKTKSIIKGPKCGQCEDHNATVSCTECVEDYCSSCFVAFHLKGALTKHRSRPIGLESIKTPRPDVYQRSRQSSVTSASLENNALANELLNNSNQFTENNVNSKFIIKSILKKNKIDEEENKKEKNSGNNINEKRKTSLFDGNFDEEKSAESFQQALAQWRSGKPGANRSSSQASPHINRAFSETGTGTQNNGPIGRPSTAMVEYNNQTFKPDEFRKNRILFSKSQQSLSYIDQLYLKKFNKRQFGSFGVSNVLSKQGGTFNQLKKSHSDLEFRIDSLIEDIKTNGELAEILIGNKNSSNVRNDYQEDNEIETKISEKTKHQSKENDNFQKNIYSDPLKTVYSKNYPKFSKKNFINSEIQKLGIKLSEIKVSKTDNYKDKQNNKQHVFNFNIKGKTSNNERQSMPKSFDESLKETSKNSFLLKQKYEKKMNGNDEITNVSDVFQSSEDFREKNNLSGFSSKESGQVKRQSEESSKTKLQEKNTSPKILKNNLKQNTYENNSKTENFFENQFQTGNYLKQNEEISLIMTGRNSEKNQSTTRKETENFSQKKKEKQDFDTFNEKEFLLESSNGKAWDEKQSKLLNCMNNQTEKIFPVEHNENKSIGSVPTNKFASSQTQQNLCQASSLESFTTPNSFVSPKNNIKNEFMGISFGNEAFSNKNSSESEKFCSFGIDDSTDCENGHIEFLSNKNESYCAINSNHENMKLIASNKNEKISKNKNLSQNSIEISTPFTHISGRIKTNFEKEKVISNKQNNKKKRNSSNISHEKLENLTLKLNANESNDDGDNGIGDDGDDDGDDGRDKDGGNTTRSFYMRQSFLKKNFEKMEKDE